MPYELIAKEVGRCGTCIYPNFLSETLLCEVRNDLKSLQKEGVFREAGIGQGKEQSVQDSIRQNNLYWLSRETQNKVQAKLWTEIDHLKKAFNRNLFLGLNDFEGHYAVYPPGGFYHRHLDSFRADQTRMVSLVLYLNETWTPEDGGELRIFKEEGQDDIAPRGGTLACFLSRETDHEVLRTRVERLSFTGWFKI